MVNSRRLGLLLAVIGTAVIGAAAILTIASAGPTPSVSGVVVDGTGPVGGATVRMRATDLVTYTSPDGSFTLGGLPEEQIELTAWADGYYVANTYVTPTVSGITLTLRPYHQVDNPAYQWTSPVAGTSSGACGNCHPMIVNQWQNNAHGQAIDNARFFSLYNGSNLSGTLQIGPGYLNDFPGTAGSCANCHAAGAGIDGYLTTNMNAVRADITAGIHCDYCHKVGGVYLDPATGTVYPNAPGAQSQRLLRPPAGDNIFFGPFDDIKDPDTYLPLYAQSQYCAVCHQFSFWGTPIYESYDEWLASPYKDAGVTCQTCHMLPNGDSYFALPEVGGLEHPPESIPSHLQVGASNPDLLASTVSMTISARQTATQLQVTVAITNTGAGHHVPTDYPGRHLILTVTAEDGDGQPLPQLGGPVVPAWGGPEAGQPGLAFAKILRDALTGDAPVVTYWKQSLIVSDNRLPALTTSRTIYTFALPPGVSGDPQVDLTARLIFRRLFRDLALQKGWDKPDIPMEEAHLTLPLRPTHQLYLPLLLAQP